MMCFQGLEEVFEVWGLRAESTTSSSSLPCLISSSQYRSSHHQYLPSFNCLVLESVTSSLSGYLLLYPNAAQANLTL
jgi:hypothetical protein